MGNSIFSKWWFWLIIILLLLFVFTPLSVLIKYGLFPQTCNTWIEGNNDIKNTCDNSEVCVPRNKADFCSKNPCQFSGSGYDLAKGHTINNPAQGVCKPAFRFSD